MTIGKLLTDHLKQLASVGPSTAAARARTIAVGTPPAAATLSIHDFDRYSVAFETLTVGASDQQEADTRSYLSARAAEIARHLSFLEEPLAVWELDGRHVVAQLRSSPPQREGEEIHYWEVELHAGASPSASITRYRWAPGLPEREPVAYPATFTLVARMADALEAALA